MTPENEAGPGSEPAQPAGDSPEAPRRSHHSRRGRRGRGRRRKPAQPQVESGTVSSKASGEVETVEPETEALRELEPGPEGEEEAETVGQSTEPEAEAPSRPPSSPPPSTRARPASVQDAIDHVNHVIQSLREALEEMEDVLELLESLERQSGADEREIESLRRALRQLQRPREGGHYHGKH